MPKEKPRVGPIMFDFFTFCLTGSPSTFIPYIFLLVFISFKDKLLSKTITVRPNFYDDCCTRKRWVPISVVHLHVLRPKGDTTEIHLKKKKLKQTIKL